MKNLNRRSAVVLGAAAASLAVRAVPVAAQSESSIASTDAAPFPGVVVRTFGEERSLIPGFKTVSMRDVILKPGAKLPENAEMMNPMLCHITEGELRVVQDGKTFTAKKNYAWTCNTGTKEHVVNDSQGVAIMRILDLKA